MAKFSLDKLDDNKGGVFLYFDVLTYLSKINDAELKRFIIGLNEIALTGDTEIEFEEFASDTIFRFVAYQIEEAKNRQIRAKKAGEASGKARQKKTN